MPWSKCGGIAEAVPVDICTEAKAVLVHLVSNLLYGVYILFQAMFFVRIKGVAEGRYPS
ncbi:hypothetical protein [Phaeobacter inhibens]|uniref:hypothetical protein n=1 Tax=Phaeobacter inhibens TaxID=221822 RepID=UPI001C2F1E6A|nr:hypothetical protein [Phaeobacter inhibens]